MLEIARHLRNDLARLDHKALFALVYAAIGLTCITYFKNPDYLAAILANTRFAAIGDEAARPTANNLYSLDLVGSGFDDLLLCYSRIVRKIRTKAEFE
ncbi:MAG: hypothetical protein IPP63_20095 [Chloracidobacterium sp.]|nr:hypothetical protein [Chloracidobacterium sp.]